VPRPAGAPFPASRRRRSPARAGTRHWRAARIHRGSCERHAGGLRLRCGAAWPRLGRRRRPRPPRAVAPESRRFRPTLRSRLAGAWPRPGTAHSRRNHHRLAGTLGHGGSASAEGDLDRCGLDRQQGRSQGEPAAQSRCRRLGNPAFPLAPRRCGRGERRRDAMAHRLRPRPPRPLRLLCGMALARRPRTLPQWTPGGMAHRVE
jgi:hypothetical protein